jgi:hypothetical protein
VNQPPVPEFKELATVYSESLTAQLEPASDEDGGG